MIQIRRATPEDLSAITDIYNEAILNTTATFDTTPKTDEEQRSWFDHHGEQHPVLVAENASGQVVGWASISAWSDRCAYSETGEVSVYVAAPERGQGVGRLLLNALDQTARSLNYHVLLARIAEGNPASIRLHESTGFESVGVMKEVGMKFGRRLDVLLMQKLYE